jgi:hypothetical protein
LCRKQSFMVWNFVLVVSYWSSKNFRYWTISDYEFFWSDMLNLYNFWGGQGRSHKAGWLPHLKSSLLVCQITLRQLQRKAIYQSLLTYARNLKCKTNYDFHWNITVKRIRI